MIPIKLEKRYPESRDEDITDAFMQGYLKGKADRPQGKWKCMADCGVTECDQCGWSIEEYVGDYNYCPNCGADMRGKDNG